jgi:hypothetical protein
MFQGGRDLVFEFLAVDGGTAAAGSRRVAGLEHEVGDYTVEEEVVVVAASGEGFKVFAGLEGLVGWGGGRGWRRVPWGRGRCRVLLLLSPLIEELAMHVSLVGKEESPSLFPRQCS